MDHRDLVSGLFWLGISAFVCFESSRSGIGTFHSPGPGLFPFWASVVIGVLAIVLLFSSRLKTSKRNITDLWKGTEWKKVGSVLFSLFLYPLVLPVLGYLATTFALMVVSLSIMGRAKVWVHALSALVIVWTSYLVFRTLLGIALPQGVLGF